jgi:hypothetical protein
LGQEPAFYTRPGPAVTLLTECLFPTHRHEDIPPMLTLPTYDDVAAAARRLEGHAHRTPVLRSRTADQELGAQVAPHR